MGRISQGNSYGKGANRVSLKLCNECLAWVDSWYHNGYCSKECYDKANRVQHIEDEKGLSKMVKN